MSLMITMMMSTCHPGILPYYREICGVAYILGCRDSDRRVVFLAGLYPLSFGKKNGLARRFDGESAQGRPVDSPPVGVLPCKKSQIQESREPCVALLSTRDSLHP